MFTPSAVDRNKTYGTLIQNKENSLRVFIPKKQLLNQSLQIESKTQKSFDNWSKEDHASSHKLMQFVASAWKNDHITDQYMIFGKVESNHFKWEMVPYQKCSNCIYRMIQQIKVLWRIVFGGVTLTKESYANQIKNYKEVLSKNCIPFFENLQKEFQPSENTSKGDDSFCKDDVIERQWVLKGKKVNILYNYAPIGFGGERLHFLVVPKNHRETFTDVTEEEYSESLELTQKLVDHLSESRKTVKNIYLLNKTGVDAGQTVKHWHLHVIFSMNTAQDFWGKITVLKNILLGSSPMQKNELEKKISELRNELNLDSLKN